MIVQFRLDEGFTGSRLLVKLAVHARALGVLKLFLCNKVDIN